jgi:hypothetical protein
MRNVYGKMVFARRWQLSRHKRLVCADKEGWLQCRNVLPASEVRRKIPDLAMPAEVRQSPS